MRYSIVLLLAVVFSTVCWGQVDEPILRVGTAMADISPPVGVPLAGYGGGKRRLEIPDLDPTNYHTLLAPSEGILDPLITKVLVLESGDTKIAIVKLDSIGVSHEMVNDVAKKIAATGITRDHLTLIGTHTHSGPGAMTKDTFWAVAAVDLFESRIYDPFVEKVANLIIQANANLKEARFGVGTGLSFDLSRNRRKHPGVFDPMIGVFKIEHANGVPLAIMFNFAIHGTCYGDDNLKMSADVMGYAERYIEKVMAEQNTPVPALFFNSTEGDVSPAKGGAEGAKLVGEALGRRVLDIMPGISTHHRLAIDVENSDISFRKAHLNIDLFPPEKDQNMGEIDCWGVSNYLRKILPSERTKLKIDVSDMVPLRFRLQAIRLGEVVIACVPGEPLTNVGIMLKKRGGQAGFAQTFTFGLANGHMGYVTDEENFDEGGYEAMLTLYGRDEAEVIVTTFELMFQRLRLK